MKFGGSSLATPDHIRRVGRMVLDAAAAGPIALVVSAFQGVTNELLACARLAERRDAACEQRFEQLAVRHRAAVGELLGANQACRTRAVVDQHLGELENVLHGIRLLAHCPPAALDLTASFGERLSAIIVAAYLNGFRPSRFVDARRFVTTDDRFTQANVDFARTTRAARQFFSDFWRDSAGTVPVITGFIASTDDGRTTTIGRNGSDYTAAIVGAAFEASAIEIWTDVDGVLSADPKAVSSAFVLRNMTYEEAMEMSYFGAKVLHANTIAPAVAKSIPILIKNTFHPEAPGTLISRRAANGCAMAKGISSAGDLALLTLRTRGHHRVRGAAERLFRALSSVGVNVVLVSQASSEHAISVAVAGRDIAAAVEALNQEFRFERQHGLIALEQTPDQAIIAVVGEGMRGRPDVPGQVFGALARNNVHVRAMAQGSSGRNLSCIVDAAQQVRALNVIHQRFFERRKTLAVAVVGVGNIGGTLLRQLHDRQPYLRGRGFETRLIAVADSKRFAIARDGIDLARWRETLDASTRPMDPRALAHEIAALNLADAVLVDCTADPSIVDAYPEFVKANLHLITPNKRANVLPWRRYKAFGDLLAAQQKHFLYETNVGAGLPIISTLRDLIASGDVITRVEGIFSGTLSYLFNSFDGTQPFSALVRDAHRMGFTEPDPREDLGGQDVARKLLILARETGVSLELEDVTVESLVPRRLAGGPFSPAFLSDYAVMDAVMERRLRRARSSGAVLRYVGTFEGGRATAGVKEFPRDHRFASTSGSDNIIAFTTYRYAHTPLVVQGPGAGADVTAMGVFSDILKLLHYLPQ